MALTYYIRSWDPRSTYPKNPQEGDICYTITLDQTWAPVGGVKKDNIVKEEIYQNGAWVEQGGGGGGTLLFSGSYTTVSAMGMNVANLTPLAETLTDGHLPTTLSVDLNGTVVELPAIMNGDIHTGTWGELSGQTPVFTTYPCFMFVQSSSPWSNINMALPASGSGTVSVTGVIPE